MERATSPDGSNSGSGHSSADSESSTPLHLYTSIISLMDISNKVTGAETYSADQIVCTPDREGCSSTKCRTRMHSMSVSEQ